MRLAGAGDIDHGHTRCSRCMSISSRRALGLTDTPGPVTGDPSTMRGVYVVGDDRNGDLITEL
jgi:hypothetical protein